MEDLRKEFAGKGLTFSIGTICLRGSCWEVAVGRCALGLGLSSSSGLMSHMGLVTAIRPSPSSALNSVLSLLMGSRILQVAHP